MSNLGVTLQPFMHSLSKGVLPMVFGDELWGIHLFSWFPGVIQTRVPLPSDQILKSPSSTPEAVINDGLNLIFCLALG
jgi:hypothetical protein